MANAIPRQTEQEERALAEGLLRRDPHHVNDFLERTHDAVYRLSARLTFDPDLRHDWTHEILLRILRELGEGRFVYRHPGCFWSWFRQRAHYLLIDAYTAHRKRTARLTAGEVGAEIIDNLPMAAGADPARLMESVEARRVVERCLDELPSHEQRMALDLVLLQDQPYQAVVDATGATLNTVRSWVRRARIAVRSCVGRFYGLCCADEEI